MSKPQGGMMTKEDLALRLMGREIGHEITRAEAAEAKAAGLVVVFGASDDLMEFRGAIEDEIGASNGGEALVTKDGLFDFASCPKKCGHYRKAADDAYARGQLISAFWDLGNGYSWTIATLIPHAAFEVVEDGTGYCRGIVFALTDVEQAQGEGA